MRPAILVALVLLAATFTGPHDAPVAASRATQTDGSNNTTADDDAAFIGSHDLWPDILILGVGTLALTVAAAIITARRRPTPTTRPEPAALDTKASSPADER